MHQRHLPRRTLLGGFAGATLFASSNAGAVSTSLPAEGLLLAYDIVYGGDKVGEHIVEARPDGESIRVRHRRQVDVRVLFVSAFAERHEALEYWDRSINLQSLEGHTVRDGARVDIVGRRQGEAFVATVGSRSQTVPSSVSTIDSYWLADAVEHEWAIDMARGVVLRAAKRRGPAGGISLQTDDLLASLSYDGQFLKRAELEHGGHKIVYARR